MIETIAAIRFTLKEPFTGSTAVEVWLPRNKNPLMIIAGARAAELDRDKISKYIQGVDWCDRRSPGWITLYLWCDDFMKVD